MGNAHYRDACPNLGTHRASNLPEAIGANCPGNIHDTEPRDAVIRELRENNAAREREILEMREAHDAQTRKLDGALAELAQLKALLNAQNAFLAQILPPNGIAPPSAVPESA